MTLLYDINDLNVCCHYRSSSTRATKKSYLNTHALNADDKWKSILTNVNFYAHFHCLRQLISSNKCKHYVRNLRHNHTSTSDRISMSIFYIPNVVRLCFLFHVMNINCGKMRFVKPKFEFIFWLVAIFCNMKLFDLVRIQININLEIVYRSIYGYGNESKTFSWIFF